MINTLLLSSLLLIVYIDVKYHRIPNKICYPIIFIGIILNLYLYGARGLLSSLFGFVLAILIGFVCMKLNICRLGELKILEIVGLLKGWPFLLAITFIVFIFLILNIIRVLIIKGIIVDVLSDIGCYAKLVLRYDISISTIIGGIFKYKHIPFSLVLFVATILLITTMYIKTNWYLYLL